MAPAQSAVTFFKFDFGPGRVETGRIRILPETTYNKDRRYGFDRGSTTVAATEDIGAGGISFCTAEKPFFFSADLPEGNYRVAVTLGDPAGESITTVKAELRRLMLENVHTARGKIETRTFMVNVRNPRITGGGEVRLKDREKNQEAAAWDEKLTLEFNGARPCIGALEITKVEDAVTVYVLGDSTVCDQPAEPWNSWGQMLPRFFKPGVVIANHAESGESLKSSLGAGRLDKVLSTMKAGDYLFIQYGHNDMKEKGEGIGAFTSYKDDLKRFITSARERGGIPVLVTSMHRRTFDDKGKITNSLGDYPDAVRQAAREENTALIDLNAMSKVFYEALGPVNSKVAFVDGTHHNAYGSYELAKCVVEGIKANKLGLAKFVVDEALTPFDPSHPDPAASFNVPPSLAVTRQAPEGKD